METLLIKKTPLMNPKSKEKGFTVRVVTNGRIGAEQISEEACENTTLHPDEALLANKLFIKKICKYLREGYIVELGEVGTLQPSCSSGWRATEDELTKDMVKPSLFYRPADEIASAIRGAKLEWANEKDEAADNGSQTPGSGDGAEELG